MHGPWNIIRVFKKLSKMVLPYYALLYLNFTFDALIITLSCFNQISYKFLEP